MFPRAEATDGGGTPAAQQPSPPAPKPNKHKKCGWGCNIKKGVTGGLNWADDHKAQIAGAVVGTIVGLGCEALFAETGVGVVGCAVLGGAVGSAVSYTIETKVEHKGIFSMGGLLYEGALGGVIGGLTAGIGNLVGGGIKAGVSSLLAGVGGKAGAAGVKTRSVRQLVA